MLRKFSSYKHHTRGRFSCVAKIVKKVGIKLIKKIANKYKSVKKSTQGIIVLVKMMYDYYCGKTVLKKNYKMT